MEMASIFLPLVFWAGAKTFEPKTAIHTTKWSEQRSQNEIVLVHHPRPSTFFLFFGGANPGNPHQTGCRWRSASALRYSLSRAAEKQKQRDDVWTLAINRPPLR